MTTKPLEVGDYVAVPGRTDRQSVWVGRVVEAHPDRVPKASCLISWSGVLHDRENVYPQALDVIHHTIPEDLALAMIAARQLGATPAHLRAMFDARLVDNEE